MTITTHTSLHDALVQALAPVTRWHHPHPLDGPPVRVNETGVDLWDAHVGDVRVDPDGTAHAYVYLQAGPGGQRQTRTVKHATITRWRPVITVAGGTPKKADWALSRVRPLLDGLVLTGPDGAPLTAPLHEGFSRFEDYDPGPVRVDEDPSPPRWFVPIQYATTAH